MCTSAMSNLFLSLKKMVQFCMNFNVYVFSANRNTLWNEWLIILFFFYELSLALGPGARDSHGTAL